MTLKEMRFDEMESTKVHCIDFSKTKTNTAVKHWLNLYPMEAITGNKELQGFYIELTPLYKFLRKKYRTGLSVV